MQSSRASTGRRQRYPVEIEAFVVRADGKRLPVKLVDFSDQGCRVECEGDYRVGEKLQIAVDRMGNMKAEVRWTTPRCIGTRFLAESDF